ncbi:MAG: hypothetical protein GY699_15445 [Desulfobacteraceae bacterium]|nr:hypothetical protein [Desulfobacteraceae bacterium]
MLKRILIRIILIVPMLIFLAAMNIFASESIDRWIELETQYTIIRYESIEILEQFHKTIHYGSGWWATTSSFAILSEEKNRKIATLKIDSIFERVQEILDMRKKIQKIVVHVYSDRKSLEAAFVKVYKQDCPFKAWYEYKTNTVSLNVKDMNEGMLAHELAHGIIDHFFKVRPPKDTAEILAIYVDRHLN